IAKAIGSKACLTRSRESLEMVIRSRSAREAEDRALACGDLAECLGTEGADRLAADAARLDQAGDAESLEVMAHERLAEPDMGDELGHAGLAVCEATHDAQPIHVGQGLVEGAQLAQIVGLE